MKHGVQHVYGKGRVHFSLDAPPVLKKKCRCFLHTTIRTVSKSTFTLFCPFDPISLISSVQSFAVEKLKLHLRHNFMSLAVLNWLRRKIFLLLQQMYKICHNQQLDAQERKAGTLQTTTKNSFHKLSSVHHCQCIFITVCKPCSTSALLSRLLRTDLSCYVKLGIKSFWDLVA